MGHRFESKIALQFGLVTALLTLVGAAANYSLSVAVANSRRVEHAHETLRSLDRLLSLVKDAETGQRGYVLTGRDAYREPFDEAGRAIGRELDSLEGLLRGDPETRGLTEALDALRVPIGGKLAELKETIDLRRTSGFDAALATVLTDRGRRLMDRIRGRVGDLQGAEGARLALLTAGAAEGARAAMVVSAAGVVLTIVLLAYAFSLIVGELSRRRRAEADLTRLAAIIASTDDAIIGKTLGGVITSWNPGAERLYGYPAAEAVGRHVSLLRPGEGAAAADLIARVARGEHAASLETGMRRRDGAVVDVELRVSPIRDEAGAVVGASTVARDITQRKQAEAMLREKTEALEAARARLSAAAEFAAALNQASMAETYRETLARIARVTGAPLAALYDVVDSGPPRARCAVGPDLMPMEATDLQGDGLPASVARAAAPLELVGPFGDPALRTRFGLGEAALHSVRGWPVAFRGRTLGVLVTAHAAPADAASRQFVAAALEQLAVRMDGYQVERQRLRLLSDLQGQSAALEAARLEAERANRAKSEFLAAMSHELRTPMNSIMGFTARLLRKLGPTLGERELDALHTVDRNARHLLGLINDILDLSKIEAGKMESRPEPLDLAAVARDAANQSAVLLDGKPVELVLDLPDAPVPAVADPKLLGQVVLNLLSNAAKFTDRGTVTVTVSAARDPVLGDAARLAVRDTGVGIRPEDRALLFQRFSQLDAGPSRRAAGTGLGLALSERMVRLQGGRIDVTSEPGVGSEFAVVLPASARGGRTDPAPPAAAAAPAGGAADGHGHGPEAGGDPRGVSILCVDDEPDALKYLRLTFEDAGYRVVTASSHDEAVAGARARRPDLVCLDLSMPGKDGFEVVRSLRSDPELASVPILVVSATSEESRALRAGARRYLAKPAEAGALVEAVADLLGADAGACDVLVVEDDPDARRLAADALAERGIRVRTAGDGREGLARMAERVPSAVVLDLMMPVMDGFAFLERVGLDPAWRHVPVVVLTARSLDAGEAAALGRSCAAVVAKGMGDAGRLADAVLQAVRPRLPEAALV